MVWDSKFIYLNVPMRWLMTKWIHNRIFIPRSNALCSSFLWVRQVYSFTHIRFIFSIMLIILLLSLHNSYTNKPTIVKKNQKELLQCISRQLRVRHFQEKRILLSRRPAIGDLSDVRGRQWSFTIRWPAWLFAASNKKSILSYYLLAIFILCRY